MKEHSIKDLGTLVHLFMKGNHPNTAQVFLDEMQVRINEVAIVPGMLETEPNEILTELPMVETTESKLEYKPTPAPAMSDDVRLDCSDYPEPKAKPRGPLRDDQGNVTRVSVLIEERGYDPDAHDNKELKIFCDGVHILTAHTADTVEGLVRYYEKNTQGRIKTLEVRGKVEIRGL